MLTQARLKSILHYDPETGVFTRLVASKNTLVGTVAGYVGSGGYRSISVLGRAYQAAHLAWLYQTGAMPPNTVDHKNRNPADDRWENLRLATQAENCANRGTRRDSASGRKGVVWSAERGCWLTRLYHKRKVVHESEHTTVEDAGAAYDAAAREIYGDYVANIT